MPSIRAGLRGLKYGVTRDYVMGLEVVLPSGEVLHTGGKCKKDVAGYNLTSLFVGSEGTLGVITQAMLRLLPLPETQKTALAFFDSVDQAALVVAEIIAARIIPVTLELLDDVSIRCVETYAHLGLPGDAGAMLLIEVDGNGVQVEDEMRRIAAICESNGATRLEVARDPGTGCRAEGCASGDAGRPGAGAPDHHFGRRYRPSQPGSGDGAPHP